MFPNSLKAVKENGQDTIISLNYKVKRGDGTWMNVYQKSRFLVSPITGLPTIGYGVVTDVSEFASDQFVYQSVERLNPDTRQAELIHKFRICVNEYEVQFTCTEQKILPYLAEGLSSKQIGDRMKVSVHTVNNHRQNILRKVNCKNTAELMAFVARTGIK
jgi:DNA-binding CsgD family transcriptional regulator